MRQPIPILARGHKWLIVAKPPHVICHRNAQARKADAMLQRVRDQIGERIYLVHRLDRNTSGCLIIATDPEVSTAMHNALVKGQKTYIALVRGHFKHQGEVAVDTDIPGKHGPQKALSYVRALGASHEPRCSLLSVRPQTGRHHQVRRHVRDLHHPVLGDREHGDHRESRVWRVEHGLSRLGLHALRVELDLPEGGRLRVNCPLFADHRRVFEKLPYWEQALVQEPALGMAPIHWQGQDGMEAPSHEAVGD